MERRSIAGILISSDIQGDSVLENQVSLVWSVSASQKLLLLKRFHAWLRLDMSHVLCTGKRAGNRPVRIVRGGKEGDAYRIIDRMLAAYTSNIHNGWESGYTLEVFTQAMALHNTLYK